MSNHATMSGPLPAMLGNAVSDAINAALRSGMEVDEACSVALGVVRDYWLTSYDMDDKALEGLSAILRHRPCECYRCLTESGSTVSFGPLTVPITATRMVVCETCGNKRCPHATDHRHACTGSNEPGQPGSRYA
jgi:hypothetical protein